MVVVQDRETLDILSKANAEIMGKPGTDTFYGAPTAVVVLADSEAANWVQDGSLVMGNLMIAAASIGVLDQPGQGVFRHARRQGDAEEAGPG